MLSEMKQPIQLGRTTRGYTVGPIQSKALIHNDHLKPETSTPSAARGGVITPFQYKLHDMLDENKHEEIISWQSHGRAFCVRKPIEFVRDVMPIYFNQTKFASFQRQLNLYGFRRLTHGRDKGAYYHEFFLRGHRSLCQGMTRQKIKGTKVRRAVPAVEEPDFWRMAFLPSPVTNNRSSSIDVNSKNNSSSNSLRIQSPKENISSGNAEGPSTPTLCYEVMTVENDQLLFFEGKPFHYLDKALMTSSVWNTVDNHQDVGI